MMDTILPVEDLEVSETLEKIFRKKGIEIYTKTKVEEAKVKDGIVEVKINSNGEIKTLKAEKVLNSIGVTGNVENIGLEKLGIEIFKNHIKVNKETYRTNIDNIYAIGDVIGPPWLAHVASAEGIYCVEKLKGLNPPMIDYNSIPGCTYCIPQVASIGLTEKKALEEGYKIKIGKFPLFRKRKSRRAGRKRGICKNDF